MISIQTAFLIFSFTFYAPLTPSINVTNTSTEVVGSGSSEIEAEQCFHELTEEYVKSALTHSSSQAYAALDAMTQKSDGYQSEAISVALGHLFYEDTADFLDYYLSQSSTDFQFLFLSELEINCEMQTESEVHKLTSGWLAQIQSAEISDSETDALVALLYQIENL